MSEPISRTAIDNIIGHIAKVTLRTQALVSIGSGVAKPSHFVTVVADDKRTLRLALQAIARAFTKSNIPVDLASPSEYTPVRLSRSGDYGLYLLGVVVPDDADEAFFEKITKGPISVDGKLTVPVSGTIYVCDPAALLANVPPAAEAAAPAGGGAAASGAVAAPGGATANPLIVKIRAAGQKFGGVVAVPLAVLLVNCERFPTPADDGDAELTVEKVTRAVSTDELTASIALFSSKCSVPVSAVFKSAYHGSLVFSDSAALASAIAMPLLRALLSVLEVATSRSSLEGNPMMQLNKRADSAAEAAERPQSDDSAGFNTKPLHLQSSMNLANRFSQHIAALLGDEALKDELYTPIGLLGARFVQEGIDGKALVDLPDERIARILDEVECTLGMKRAMLSLIAASRKACA